LIRAVIRHFFIHNWCPDFRVLSDPGKNFLFGRGVLLSLSREIQNVLKCRFHTNSWGFECPHQRIDQQWNIVSVFSEGIANRSWKRKFSEAWQEDFE
jgi:hypothetical protein